MLRPSKVSSVPVNYLLSDHDVLAALADVERARKREEELRNKTRIRRLKDTGNEWARLCSCHGVPHLAQARSVPSFIIWAVIVTATLVGLAYFTVDTIRIYLRYDTDIVINLESVQAVFPSITICNSSPYKLSKMNNVPQLYAMVSLYIL